MPITKAQLKKFKVGELKDIIRKYKIGKVGGNKAQLLGRIYDSSMWKNIKDELKMPEKKKRKFSEKQLAAQAKFKEMVAKKKKNMIKKSDEIKQEQAKELVNQKPLIVNEVSIIDQEPEEVEFVETPELLEIVDKIDDILLDYFSEEKVDDIIDDIERCIANNI